ncbi:hypothetical protein MBRA_05204 [Methylobacterium brachiatum]|nr:hypothetical protein MBRA_05204 [Methylobacterium brachiatum]
MSDCKSAGPDADPSRALARPSPVEGSPVPNDAHRGEAVAQTPVQNRIPWSAPLDEEKLRALKAGWGFLE